MTDGWAAVCYTISFACFVLSAFGFAIFRRLNLIALGLAFFVLVLMWDALETAL